jgi:exonuclease SbcC
LKKKDVEEAKVYSDLIEFLNHYRSSKVIIPGIDKTVDEFVEILEEHNKKYRTLKSFSDAVESSLVQLENLRTFKSNIEQTCTELIKIKESSDDCSEYESDDDDFDKEAERLDNLTKSLETDCDYYEHECHNRGILDDDVEERYLDLSSLDEITPFTLYSDSQLKDSINMQRKEVTQLAKTITSQEDSLKLLSSDLKRMEKQEPHKYQDRLSDIDSLFNKTMKLESTIGKEFNGYINNIINKSKTEKITEIEKKYYNQVAEYLGRKVGFVRHIENEYKVEKIDLINGEIITDKNKIIKLTDMGTGQSQSAYLTGLLNTDDSRKIIAIFDEVAMMDETSLEPIYKKFSDLNKKGKLICGIVVQKAESVNILEKGGT